MGTESEARRIMSSVDQKPVSLNKELPGFILNRIQYPIINETWNLVADGAVSAEDIDVVMKDGLGMRYAICGTMEVIHLKAHGMMTSLIPMDKLEERRQRRDLGLQKLASLKK